MVEVFACCELPQGSGVGIVTQSGGAGVLMADRAEELGLSVPVLGEATQRALAAGDSRILARAAIRWMSPGQFVANPALLRESVKIVLADPAVHVGIVWLQLMDAYVDELITIFEEIKSQVSKTIRRVLGRRAGQGAARAARARHRRFARRGTGRGCGGGARALCGGDAGVAG